MDKSEALKYIESKGDSKFVVRTEEEEATFLTNHAKKVEDEIIPQKIKGVHDQYDQDVFAITGLKKNDTEKTYDFIKRVMSSYKTDAEKAKVLEGEISSLKEQIKNNSGDKQLKADLEDVQRKYRELQDNKEAEITKLRSEHEKFKAESLIRSALPTKVKKNLPEEAVKALTDQTVAHLLSMAQFQDGKLVFIENGVVKRNPHNALQPYTAKELAEEGLKNIIDAGRTVEGGPGLNKEVEFEKDDKGNIKKVVLTLPDSVRTKEDLSKHLVSVGLLRGTQEYLAAYREYSPSLK